MGANSTPAATAEIAGRAQGICSAQCQHRALDGGTRRSRRTLRRPPDRCRGGDLAAGIRPVALAQDAGILVNRGIVVDDCLQTGASDIFALGECAEHRGVCYGLVEPAYEQARVLARHLAGGSACYGGSVVATNLKVSGVAVFSAGDFTGIGGSETIVLNDASHGTYKKLVIADGRLTGAILVGDAGDALWYLELIRNRQPIASIRTAMMFGRALAIASEAA